MSKNLTTSGQTLKDINTTSLKEARKLRDSKEKLVRELEAAQQRIDQLTKLSDSLNERVEEEKTRGSQ
eukprot:3110827-Pyramimonas_sp.AAC.1